MKSCRNPQIFGKKKNLKSNVHKYEKNIIKAVNEEVNQDLNLYQTNYNDSSNRNKDIFYQSEKVKVKYSENELEDIMNINSNYFRTNKTNLNQFSENISKFKKEIRGDISFNDNSFDDEDKEGKKKNELDEDGIFEDNKKKENRSRRESLNSLDFDTALEKNQKVQ